ncbi:MAG: glycosyltransferase [Fusobacteriaceae bacterium]|nr:glycosyltransferase [Fusobacteriaceae bacterium]
MENAYKKNVIIRSGTLKMGGLERVLIEVLQSIEKNRYNLYLFIENNAGKENVFLNDVPDWIKVYFLKPEPIMRKSEFYRQNKKKMYYKLMYNITMNLEKYLVKKNTKKYIKEIGKPDIFLDFDAGATKYIERIDTKKKFVWLHSSVEKLIKSESKLRRYGKRLEKYDKIVAICDEMKDELERLYPYLKGKIIKIYNPFNLERILKSANDESELSQEDIRMMKEKYSLAVARLDNVQKDFSTLIKAFKELKDRGINENLYIIGEGPGKKDIEELIIQYGLEETVYLLGVRKNPYIWMKNAHFFVHSSKYEGFGLVLIEAATLGKAIISSNCKVGPKEILGNGEYGSLFNVGDYKELSIIMEEIIKNSKLRENYEIKAKERANQFESKSLIKEYYNILD